MSGLVLAPLSATSGASLFAPQPNVPPVAVADAANTSTGVPVVRPAPGVLGNDHDANGDSLTASVLTLPVNGTLWLLATGAWTYTPDAGFSGADAYTYRAFDGQAYSPPATVTIAVSPLPTPTPTPSPTPTPTPTPTPAPTPTPTPKLTPTPTPTPTPKLTPAPTPTPTPRPTPTPTPISTSTPTPSVEPTPTAGADATPEPPSTFAATRAPDPSSGTGGAVASPSLGIGPAALPRDPFTIASDDVRIDADLGNTRVGMSAILAIAAPAILISVPGLLIIVAFAAQMAGGLAWIAVVRRQLGDRRRRRPARFVRRAAPR